jgi:ferrochelatase
LDDVEPYFRHIRGGRAPSPESVAHLRERYVRVGGRTPLLDITRRTATALERELGDRRVYIGMKHWHPYIGDTMREMIDDGVERVTAIVLAPHYSRMSIGGYRKAVDEARAALGRDIDVTFVERWHMQPEFISMMAKLVDAGLQQFAPAERNGVKTVFSAHSLPVRIREWDDPYERELLQSSEAAAHAVGIRDWRFAWQSAGETGEPWLGPDILDYLDMLHAEGVKHVLQVPIGFLSEHLEILWDIDHEAREKARELGITLHRTQLPNDSPALVRTLAAVVAGAESDR